MARVLIVENGARIANATSALEAADFAVRAVTPALPGDVFEALDNVAVVAYLMADAEAAIANDEWLETVLLKVVDTGVRGFVYENPSGEPNKHVEHARSTWHIPIEEIASADDLVGAVNRSLGIEQK